MSIFSQTGMGDRSVFEMRKAALSEGLESCKGSHVRLFVQYVEYVGNATRCLAVPKSDTIDVCIGNPDYITYQQEHKRPQLTALALHPNFQQKLIEYYSSFLNRYFKDYPQMQDITVIHYTTFLYQ